jgi:hypothetical protein
VVGTPDERGVGSDRPLGVGAEALAHGRQGKASVRLFAEHPDGRERAQHAVEGPGVGVRRRRQIVGRARPLLEEVGDAERRGDVDGLRTRYR